MLTIEYREKFSLITLPISHPLNVLLMILRVQKGLSDIGTKIQNIQSRFFCCCFQ